MIFCVMCQEQNVQSEMNFFKSFLFGKVDDIME